ncbi:hypothetical protein L249_8692 [Ophiocordyceps polyrhachis-furcata BCC 54312]|uniref:Uncharacterized protein n=1 Tax=Ophiocordyceps polyrhachis-furcata BCC 54312 TaxID=1330021 RepID=A0A367L6H7_9HYPO|nr:hypothetical protein L249_8692 [Ophiocordyceps polyrhachis-furcata BCC 54312]
MRTRRSNRTKRFTVEKFNFESGSEEGASPPSRGERDADFGDEDADADVREDFEEEEGEEEEEEDDEENEEDEEGGDTAAGPSNEANHGGRRKTVAAARAAPRRPRRRKTQPTSVPSSSTDYRAVEPVPSDSHVYQSYSGPYNRTLRGQSLVAIWYGPRKQDMGVCQQLLDRWLHRTVLPPKSRRTWDASVWVPKGDLKREAALAERWRVGCVREEAARVLTPDEAKPYRSLDRPLSVLLGPYPNQRVITFRPGDAYCLEQDGTPYADDGDAGAKEDRVPIGWMLDVGGIVISMDWAPGQEKEQRLALAVVPHADEDLFDFEAEHRKPDFLRHGVVQIWAFLADTGNGFIRPSTRRPRLLKTLCFDCGRARRVKWSPVCDHLAVICGDGRVCVVEVEGTKRPERIQAPLATLNLSNEEGVKATVTAWATFNRLIVGYSDGSVGLWSVQPACLLGRHALHHSDVVDLATGYPTMPYLVASSPIGGPMRLVDLRSPSCESTMVQINAIRWQANLLSWSDHLLGFFSFYPSANALETRVGFMFHRHFPLVRHVFTGECLLSCLAVGRTHPYLLIGTTDGTLWSLNPQCELFKGRMPSQDRLRIFQHEHRPAERVPSGLPAAGRGASGVVHGFSVEKYAKAVPEAKTPVSAKKAKKRKKSRKKRGGGEDAADDDENGDDDDDDDEAGDEGGGGDEPLSLTDIARGIVHEPLTRITTVVWNPNPGYGCWAAASMASGLVRVLDLGLEINEDSDEDEEAGSDVQMASPGETP